ncbi:hypothetical protein K0M31_016125 [Melipona bicolor]|uniref:Uncharacterized protein n=1 Tax=Melipona bicolor TaxID=60889 RepID=A0AA40KT58_9HYME|nr:hypothetical protein K0M31_016125 [Melipona bicolor]
MKISLKSRRHVHLNRMEEIQKLAAQIEFMKIVHMEMYNRHIKPKAGGYFTTHGHSHSHPSSAQSPIAKSSTASFILKTAVERGASAAAAAAVEDSTFPSGSLHRARRMEFLRERKAEREREREKGREKEREKEKEKYKEKYDKEKEKEKKKEGTAKEKEAEMEREKNKEKQAEKEKEKQDKKQEENVETGGEV